MNQTESRRKAEGSGVGILGDSEARCFGFGAPPPPRRTPAQAPRLYRGARPRRF